ncbi:MAG: DedA family protein [Acidocella sp.]|nr:DedA family protein [Acidocella sp.]
MLHGLLGGVAGVITAVISHGGYVGIIFLMALESACLPLPSEVIMPFAGYLAASGRFDLIVVGICGAIGCNLGSAAAYAVGAHAGPGFVRRWGRYLLIDGASVGWAERLFARFGGVTVFGGRLLPVVRTFIALPAGVARMGLGRFHIYTFAGSLIWSMALAYAGYVLGRNWDNSPGLRRVMSGLDGVAVLLLVCGGVYFLWRKPRAR